MEPQHTPENTVFVAKLPNGEGKRFSLAEYLAWRKWLDIPICEKEWPAWTEWMNAEDNNFDRINAWISVCDWRKNNHDHVAAARMRLTREYIEE